MATSENPFVIPERFRKPLGFRKDGRPFYLIGGGSVGSFEPELGAPPVQTTEPPAPVQQQPEVRYFTADDIERARQEEKSKVYKRLEEETQSRKALEERLNSVLATQEQREQAEAEARRQAEEEARAQREAEMSARELLQQREQEWAQQRQALETDMNARFEQLQKEREQQAAILEQDRRIAELAAYTANRVAQEQDNIAPQLVDFIGGNSPEEIDASIERAKAKSAEIAAAVQEQIAQQRSTQRGVAPTGYAPLGPLEVAGEKREYSAEDIRNMNAEEYAKFRQQIGIGQRGGNGRGLFG